MEVLADSMEYYEVHRCDEFCPFYEKDSVGRLTGGKS